MATVERLSKLSGIHASIVDQVPQPKRGRVWCHRCGATERVDSARCMRQGWPKCCGETMSIDSPEERRTLAAKRIEEAQKP